jgi:hypothetical protein
VFQTGIARFALFLPEIHPPRKPSFAPPGYFTARNLEIDISAAGIISPVEPPHSRVLCCRLLHCYPLLLSPEGVERVAQNKQSTGSACDYHQSSLLHGRLTRNNFCFLPGWEVCDVKQGNHTHHEGQSLRPLLPQSSAGQGGFVLTMQFLQALRRSLKNDREKVNHISITPKSAVAIVPPKKVCSHRPGLPHPRGVC